MRLFIALRFSEEIIKSLSECIIQLKKQGITADFTRLENLHLTLAFIGETEDAGSVIKAMKMVQGEVFRLELSGCGSFRGIIWAGIRHSSALSSYVSGLTAALESCGLHTDKRSFSPHITLARRFSAKSEISLNIPQTSMEVNRISLMKSERTGGRLIYTQIFSEELKKQ